MVPRRGNARLLSRYFRLFLRPFLRRPLRPLREPLGIFTTVPHTVFFPDRTHALRDFFLAIFVSPSRARFTGALYPILKQ